MNRSPRLRCRRQDVLLTESEWTLLLRLSSLLKVKRSEVVRRAVRELAQREVA